MPLHQAITCTSFLASTKTNPTVRRLGLEMCPVIHPLCAHVYPNCFLLSLNPSRRQENKLFHDLVRNLEKFEYRHGLDHYHVHSDPKDGSRMAQDGATVLQILRIVLTSVHSVGKLLVSEIRPTSNGTPQKDFVVRFRRHNCIIKCQSF